MRPLMMCTYISDYNMWLYDMNDIDRIGICGFVPEALVQITVVITIQCQQCARTIL